MNLGPDLLKEIYIKYGDSKFLIDAKTNSKCTYQDLFQSSSALAFWLKANGFCKGDRIGICLENCTEYAILYFTCLLGGFIATPINNSLHYDDIKFIVENADIKILFASKITIPLVEDIFPEIGIVQSDTVKSKFGDVNFKASNELQTKLDDIDFDCLWTLHFTSGTTSFPKGVFHTPRSLFSSAINFNSAVQLNQTDRFFQVFSMAYMAGFLNSLLCPLLVGGSAVIEDAFTARRALNFWKTVIDYQINKLWLTPSILRLLLKLDRGNSGVDWCSKNIDHIFVGTAPVPFELKKSFEDRYATNVLVSYGLSECLFLATETPHTATKSCSVGQVLPNCLLHFNNGEIHVKSDSMMSGYLKPHESSYLDEDEYFATGDVGYLENDLLFITDRKKDIIIRSGLNISPRKIEEHLLRYDQISEAYVIGIDNELLGEEVVAVILTRAGQNLERNELKAHCLKRLSQSELPDRYVFDMDIPLNSNGKVNKSKLKKIISIGES
ncbi:MAG: class I adenylate-forming enzyme family protein [bacterium]|nr:class I adenylate-forming enzyme family protein [bacterium]